jgi:transcriptional regulator with XRE-family HTH domain
VPEIPASAIVADNVRAEAARARFTQGRIAELLGVSQQAVSDRMKGRTPFTVDELALLADEFGVPLTRFLPGHHNGNAA